MSQIADRYRSLAGTMTDRIAGVPADGWDAQTPCEDWKARDIVRHLVETSGMFLGFIDEELPDGPPVDEDPLGAFATARDAVQSALDDPSRAQQEYDGMFGKSTFEQGTDQFLCADLVIHAWDLARATGQDETMPPEEVERIHRALEPMDEQMRGPGAFGPKIDPPADADAQTKLLCFLGRTV